jgi:hypothetical protein
MHPGGRIVSVASFVLCLKPLSVSESAYKAPSQDIEGIPLALYIARNMPFKLPQHAVTS